MRLPNLLTVPGDVIAGYALARAAGASPFSSDLCLIIGASLSIYVAGLILNDWRDREEDARVRPERPLPSGRIQSQHALFVALILLGSALVLAALAGSIPLRVALLLVGCVIFYNFGARRTPIIGFLTMGTCRGANVLLGASVAGIAIGHAAALAIFIQTGYVTLITWTADTENQKDIARHRFYVTLVFLAGILLTFILMTDPGPFALGAALVALAYPIVRAEPLSRFDSPHGTAYVGCLVRSLIPVQATFALAGSQHALPLVIGFSLLLLVSDLSSSLVNGG